MSDHKGKVILIVNTACKCEYTDQFSDFEKLHDKYHEKGLVIIGFPSDQFYNQEFETNREIEEYCAKVFGIEFDVAKKTKVRGKNANPIFKYLIEKKGFKEQKNNDSSKNMKAFEALLKVKYGKDYNNDDIKWNFTKFLIDRNDNVIGRYEPHVVPKKIVGDIEKALADF